MFVFKGWAWSLPTPHYGGAGYGTESQLQSEAYWAPPPTIAMPIVLLESVRFATYHLVSVYARGLRVQSGSRILFSRESDPSPGLGSERQSRRGAGAQFIIT